MAVLLSISKNIPEYFSQKYKDYLVESDPKSPHINASIIAIRTK